MSVQTWTVRQTKKKKKRDKESGRDGEETETGRE